MFEIPLLTQDVLAPDKAQTQAAKLTARLARIIRIVKKLIAADWSIEWTITGLAFQPPRHGRSGPEPEPTPASIRQQLTALGIKDDFRPVSSRSLLDLVRGDTEYEDRAWYVAEDHWLRTYVGDDDDDEASQCFRSHDYRPACETLRQLIQMERRYSRTDLIVDNDYVRGVVTGRHQALRWLLGEAWPELKNPEWEEAMEEDDRDFEAEMDANERLGELLHPDPEPSPASSKSLNGEHALPPASTASNQSEAIARSVKDVSMGPAQ